MSLRPRYDRNRIAIALGTALALLVVTGGDLAEAQRVPAAATPPLGHAQNLSRAFRYAASVAMPTVVTVRSRSRSRVVRGDDTEQNPFKGTPLEEYFGEDFKLPDSRTPGREGMGSGVIIDASGLVLTNNHVVEGADEVTIRLSDGREFKATDIKRDPQTDLAVLRIKGAGSLPAARLGDSDQLQIGDWVIAVGNPFELEQTVSAGIISGKGRELSSVRRAKFLQTDAAINPGNSGGPLVNLAGEVVGINTAIASNNGRFQGIGFAIPANLARWVTRQLIEKGSVERAYLGVAIGEITQQRAERFGVRRGEGVLVANVYPDSPAAEAGFEAGDVITRFGTRRVAKPRDLQEVVERMPYGRRQSVDVIRGGEKKTLYVLPRAMPSEFSTAERGGR